LADVVLGPWRRGSHVFKVKSIAIKVDTLKFSVRDSKHDFLYRTLKPLATGFFKKKTKEPSVTRSLPVWSMSMDNLSASRIVWQVLKVPMESYYRAEDIVLKGKDWRFEVII